MGMQFPPQLRRAPRAVLAAVVLCGGFALISPARAVAATSDLSNPPGEAGGLSNGVPTASVDPAELQFDGSEGGPVGGAAQGGYVMASSDGKIYTFGGAAAAGQPRDFRLTKPVVDIAGTPSGLGYWLVASDGGIFTFGDAGYFGSLGNLRLNKPIVGMAGTPNGRGYWLVAADGGIFSFGDATFHGSTGDLVLKERITGMAATPTGRGYWLVASDGGIFSFGDAAFKGSTGNLTLTQPIVGMAATATGNGYWMVASDGGIFCFGDATFKGSTGNIRLAEPIVGMAATATGNGYWLGAADGGVFTFGDAEFKGSMTAGLLNGRIVGMMPQGGDVRAPVLRHLAFGPTTIDTSNGPATVKFRANITDDLAGHGLNPPSWRGEGETQVIFANPAGQLTHLGLNVFFRDSDRIAGDRLDGIYRSYAVLPPNSPPGIWRLSSITMSDNVGNRVNIDGAVLAQAGFPTTFEQIGVGDADAPEVVGLSVTPDRIDTSLGPAEVRVSARVVDHGTGVASVNAGVSNRNTNTGGFLQRVSGDEHDGVYEGRLTIPRYAHQGWWSAGVQVIDNARNLNGFGANFPSAGFTQVAPGDENPPTVVSVAITPPSIDTSASAATVTATVHVTDDLSGLTTTEGFAEPWMSYQLFFLSPSQQMVEGRLRFVSGTARDALYEATVTVPRYSEQGTWRLNQISVRDNALNWNYLQPDVANPPTFEVVRTENRP